MRLIFAPFGTDPFIHEELSFDGEITNLGVHLGLNDHEGCVWQRFMRFKVSVNNLPRVDSPRTGLVVINGIRNHVIAWNLLTVEGLRFCYGLTIHRSLWSPKG